MERKYNEILKLKDMLERAKIPFKFSELMGGYHIVYPTDGGECICSVIEHDGSYGREKDLLEIQGLMTKEELEETQDTVIGYLTAKEVFQRIKDHWEKRAVKEKSHWHFVWNKVTCFDEPDENGYITASNPAEEGKEYLLLLKNKRFVISELYHCSEGYFFDDFVWEDIEAWAELPEV